MFKIIKKTSAVWQHELNGQIIHLSSFGVVADISLQTFILRALNGSYFPNQSVGIANIIVIDETDGSVEESFGTINELLNRLIELNYTPYITENSLQLTLQQVTDNGATTTNQIATGNLTIDEVGGGDPCINTNQSLADGSIISSHFDTDSEFGISVRFPATITGNRNIDYPDANGTIATEEWVLDNLPVGGVESVNGQTGVVVLDADDINDSATTNKFVTSAEKSTWNGKQNELNGTGFVKASGTTISYDNNTYLTPTTVITNVEKNAYEYRCTTLGTTNATNIGQAGAGIVTSGVASATLGGTKFKLQNRFNYATTAVAGTIAYFRTTFQLINLNSGFVCEWLFGTADSATVAGARSFVGVTGSFANPNNVEPTTLVNCVGLARLSTSNNWHIIHNDASGVCTSIDLGSGYPSNTLEVDLIYLRLTFNTDGTISYIVANKTTNVSTSGTLSTNLPAVGLYETIWTTNNATALIARLGFCYRTFNNPY